LRDSWEGERGGGEQVDVGRATRILEGTEEVGVEDGGLELEDR
jgi:hypothetical protein